MADGKDQLEMGAVAMEGLLEEFRACYELSSAETVERLTSAAREFGGSIPWEDDVTLLVVKPS